MTGTRLREEHKVIAGTEVKYGERRGPEPPKGTSDEVGGVDRLCNGGRKSSVSYL